MSVSPISSSTDSSYLDELFSLVQAARQRQGVSSEPLSSLDSDANGRLDVEESGWSHNYYEASDSNGDGVISLAELEKAAELQRSALNSRVLLEDAARKEEASGFAVFDEDLSGSSENSEYREFLAALASGELIRPRSEEDGFTGESVENEFDKYEARTFSGMDKDGSGTISREEWGLNQVDFDSLDANKDGMISADEMGSAFEKQMEKLRDNYGHNAAQSDPAPQAQNVLASRAGSAYQANSAYVDENGGPSVHFGSSAWRVNMIA